ncbi:hypothetical protein FACS1894187_01580 [Synergistales bacterium]|nr:hypothetical protein FACS1894187_01580 [Synergistales bacterium]
MLLFCGAFEERTPLLDRLQVLIGQGQRISLGFSFMAEKILDTKAIVRSLNPLEVFGEEDVFKMRLIVETHDWLAVPNITVNTLSKVALGMVDSFVSQALWVFLRQGKKTYLDFRSARCCWGLETQNREMRRLIDQHIETVTKMGALELPARETPVTKAQPLEPDKRGTRAVITEKDVLSLDKGQKLVLEKGTIMTSLARDRAGLLGITLETKK